MFLPLIYRAGHFSESSIASVFKLVDSNLLLHMDKEGEQTAQTTNFVVTL